MNVKKVSFAQGIRDPPSRKRWNHQSYRTAEETVIKRDKPPPAIFATKEESRLEAARRILIATKITRVST